jgi:transcriptional regulator with PAS, ATPase and Fis domain
MEGTEGKVFLVGEIGEYAYDSFSMEELQRIIFAINMKLERIKRAKEVLEKEEDRYLTLQSLAAEEIRTILVPGLDTSTNVLKQVEAATVYTTLHENNNNRTKAAKELGITRRSLLRRVDKLKAQGIDV